MEKVLYLAHTEENGLLPRVALEALTAAKKLSEDLKSELVLGIFGESTEHAVNVVSGLSSSKLLTVNSPDLKTAHYATDASAIEKICKAAEVSYVVAPSTSRISRVLGGVSYRLGGRIDTHVAEFNVGDDTLSVTRWFYKQRMKASLKRVQRPWFFTVDSGNFEAFRDGENNPLTPEKIPFEANEILARTTVEGFKAPSADEQTIKPDADLLFVAGAGWSKKQGDGQQHTDKAANLIKDFLKESGASLGGSKSVVDMGTEGESALPFMTHLNQVGQTGSTPRHPKGLATCCHGEEPHVVGWRFINERRAINLDPNCGWAQGKADVLYVADAFDVMAKVDELLSS